jgi:hypothetical protein
MERPLKRCEGKTDPIDCENMKSTTELLAESTTEPVKDTDALNRFAHRFSNSASSVRIDMH